MPDFLRPQLEGQLIRCATAPTELTGRAAPEWIHVFPAVLFNHWLIGTVDPSTPLLDLLVHNNNRYDGHLVVDYNHASVDSDDAPAAGFIDVMERRESGIYAHISEWTDKARAGIESGEWRYISPTWYLAAWSRHDGSWIGPAWHSVALTNTPQIDGMDEVPDRVAAAHRAGRHLSLPQHVFLPDPASAKGASPLLFVPPFTAPTPVQAATPDPSPGDTMKSFPLLLAALALAADFDLEAEDADEKLAAAAANLQTSEAQPEVPAELLTALEVESDGEAVLSACLGKVALLRASAVDPETQGKLLLENLELRASARVRDASLAPAAVPHALALAKAVREAGDPADKAFEAFLASAPRIPSSVPTPATSKDTALTDKATSMTLTAAQRRVAKSLGVSEEAYAAQLNKSTASA